MPESPLTSPRISDTMIPVSKVPLPRRACTKEEEGLYDTGIMIRSRKSEAREIFQEKKRKGELGR